MFMYTAVFAGYSGFCLTSAWFQRRDDFMQGVPGPAVASSALTLEVRQRQLISVLRRGRDPHAQVGVLCTL